MRHTIRHVFALAVGWGYLLSILAQAHPALFPYIHKAFDGTVSAIDTAPHTVTATLPGVAAAAVVGLGNVAVHPAGTRVYVANTGHQICSVIHPTPHTVIDTVPMERVAHA